MLTSCNCRVAPGIFNTTLACCQPHSCHPPEHPLVPQRPRCRSISLVWRLAGTYPSFRRGHVAGIHRLPISCAVGRIHDVSLGNNNPVASSSSFLFSFGVLTARVTQVSAAVIPCPSGLE